MVLESLLDKKGVLSRQIGEAKKNGQVIDSLVAEMKQVTQEIKREQAKLKEAKKVETGVELESSAEKNNGANIWQPMLFSELKPQLVDQGVSVSFADESIAEEWDRYVLSRKNSAIYHRYEFKAIVERSFGHKTLYVVARDQSGNIVGVLPSVEMKSALFGHFITSLPYFTYGGCLANNQDIEESLIAYLVSYAEKEGVSHIELRNQRALLGKLSGLPSRDNKVSMLRKLPAETDELWADIGTKVRAQIKKADRFELKCVFGGVELVDDFYTVFAKNMRDLGTPVYAKNFFENLLQSRVKESFIVGVVYHKGKPVACCFLMLHNEMMEIPWASALSEFNHMNVNMFMYWNVLQQAVLKECKYFDFGRSSKDASTYRFKKQWGARPYQLYWHYWLPAQQALPELNPNNPKYKLLISIWQRLPVWLTKLIGPPVVKYLP